MALEIVIELRLSRVFQYPRKSCQAQSALTLFQRWARVNSTECTAPVFKQSISGNFHGHVPLCSLISRKIPGRAPSEARKARRSMAHSDVPPKFYPLYAFSRLALVSSDM